MLGRRWASSIHSLAVATSTRGRSSTSRWRTVTTRYRYRITTVGAYTYKKLLPTFIYLDAIVVDTPIVDHTAADAIAHSREVEDRLVRAKSFLSYLDEQWGTINRDNLPFDWTEVSRQL